MYDKLLKPRRDPHHFLTTFRKTRSFRLWTLVLILAVATISIFRSVTFSEDQPLVVRLDDALRNMWIFMEQWNIISAPPAFSEYRQEYPFLELLDDNWKVIQEEALQIYSVHHDKIPTTGKMSGFKYKLYIEDWKSVGFKLGGVTALLLPEPWHCWTSRLRIWSMSFSAVSSREATCTRTTNNETYFRINDFIEKTHHTNIAKRTDLINTDPRTVVHFYREGRGFMFDDTHLHDVHNRDPAQVRVVVYADVLRKLPLPLDVLNRLVNFILNRYNGRVAAMRKRAALATV